MECGILNGDLVTFKLNMEFSLPTRIDSGSLAVLDGSFLTTLSCRAGEQPVRNVLTARVCILHWLGPCRVCLQRGFEKLVVVFCVFSWPLPVDSRRLAVGWGVTESKVCDLRGEGIGSEDARLRIAIARFRPCFVMSVLLVVVVLLLLLLLLLMLFV